MNPFGDRGHHHHHLHRREEEEEENRFPPPGYYPPRPAPPYSGGPPYPPAVEHVAHEGRPGHGPQPPFYPPPPGYHGGGEQYHGPPPPYYPPASGPGYPGERGYGYDHHPHHHVMPHFPGSHHVSHESHEGGEGAAPPPQPWHGQPTVRIYTKAEPNFSLSIRDGKVILARNDPSDPYQHWIKDMRYSTRVKDEEGFPSFALINKATGEAIKHSIGATHPVRLIPYNPDYLDESVLWAESKDLGDGFRCTRMVNNIRLNFDAFHGDKNHGGVRDGTILVLWEWLKGDNQRWKIVPYCKLIEITLALPLNCACGTY